MRRKKAMHPYLFKKEVDTSKVEQPAIEDDYSDNENGLEMKNKPVDRTKKLTQNKLNKKLIKRMNRDEQEKAM